MIFIKYDNITNEETIDVRSKSEFNQMHLFKYNLPIINEIQHKKIKCFYPCALFIIINSLLKNKSYFREQLLKISNNKQKPIIIACSRGRLRSPIVFLYAKILRIPNCKILLGGLKPIYKREQKKLVV
ncbi:MAG: hypothetical protein ACRC28_07720 [Clostridium sp.]|uniref:hypothetical protein n=1 Tax=Clostridium sp. TaxID=1506 RepID=UPI003F3A4CC7